MAKKFTQSFFALIVLFLFFAGSVEPTGLRSIIRLLGIFNFCFFAKNSSQVSQSRDDSLSCCRPYKHNADLGSLSKTPRPRARLVCVKPAK